MRVLAIESSSTVASVAVVTDEKVEGEVYINNKLQHSVLLFPIIENLFKTLGIKVDDLDAVAVSGGPGSFTGLRIGVSAAKGIAQGRDLKFIGVSSLDALAFMQNSFDGVIVPMMDALRENVYTAIYKFENDELIKLHDYDALHIDELVEKLIEYDKVLFCGDAIKLHAEKLKNILKNIYLSKNISTYPRAAAIGEIALKRLKDGISDNINTYSPIYIRKSQAEREYEKRVGIIE
ncbi:tRNA threonylcarbamoyladenosine biosynthesis protein TsaB [Caloramator mitchellensis]|uniref:tRNA threonylcarbamoyladenosine biosynthesis protein TsaB n=1 Tax=Caloramator mitchellensis TaxID=908809 RepID=A0A0R3JVT9_CALMK|nr:tRNA (adenosine(37)-N6)-threonylcarbamoyltransferase complex dimerization subunit type 1 TsaB [Caloramator mitchellensis]KRQ87702.1 tRNA threonylcarbamoyladenosine biosynthesis protein TsaB [Caloramator mitchellensis]